MTRLLMAWMPTCRELTEALAGDGLASLPWPRRLLARLHLARCELCARFARQLQRIGEALRASWAPAADAGLGPLRDRVVARLRRL